MAEERYCIDSEAGWVLRGLMGRLVVSVVAKWYCGCLTVLLDIDEMKNVQRNRGCWDGFQISGLEEGRSATQISTAVGLSASF